MVQKIFFELGFHWYTTTVIKFYDSTRKYKKEHGLGQRNVSRPFLAQVTDKYDNAFLREKLVNMSDNLT